MGSLIETDDEGAVVIPGHANRTFLVQENSDGSVLLQPAQVITEAQYEYDTQPELRELLRRASESPTVRHNRRPSQ